MEYRDVLSKLEFEPYGNQAYPPQLASHLSDEAVFDTAPFDPYRGALAP